MVHLPHRVGRALRRLLGRTDPVILMYHRVAKTTIDPWGLSVDPANFAQHVRILAETRRPVPLDWLAGEIVAGRRPQRAVAITFDDAYRDVLENAKPVLDEHGVPATVFVVTGALGSPDGFWWDRLASAVFGAVELPGSLELSFLEPDEQQAANLASGRGDRDKLHLALWGAIRLLAPHARELAVREVGDAFRTGISAEAPVMTEAEVNQLIEGGGISVGAHSVSHPSLPSLSTEDQRRELLDSRLDLERMTGRSIDALAYPFGDFDARSEALAEELGFAYAVSVRAGAVTDKRDRFRLPRHDVKNWSADEFREQLKWFG